MDEPELGESKDMQEAPQIIDVAVTFKPIMSTLPTKGVNSKILLQGSKWIGKYTGTGDTNLDLQTDTSETGILSPVVPPNAPNIRRFI
jgi:hypothetical protein